jgi:glycosyltransferase involved in cell wall biosynthesis
VKISAVIITFNEEHKVAAAVKSVSWADEVIVIDSNSRDRTREIAAQLGVEVIVQDWLGFSKQKQFGADAARNDWIFSLDADERVSEELKQEILEIREAAGDGYRIRRLSYYMNRPIRHGGWYPDWQLRLFNRKKAKWKERSVHESVEMASGSVARQLKGHLIHYSVDGPEHHARMILERYAPLTARQMFEDGKRTTPMKAALAGPYSFFQSYVLKLGFLDGFPGYTIASFGAHHASMKHLLLLELQQKSAP